MSHAFAKIAFTPAVRAAQERLLSRPQNERMEGRLGDTPVNDRLGEHEKEFVESRDGFYMATVGETGWPYIQFRGGPIGFLKLLDERTLGFADFRGNTQYITVGNLSTNDRVALFLMDYPTQSRLKMLGHAEVIDADENPSLIEKLRMPGYKARIERAIVVHVEAFDWNCQQHIPRRFTEQQIAELVKPLQQRLEELELENKRLREELASR